MRQKTINIILCLTILFLLLQPFTPVFAPPVDDEEGLTHFPSSDSTSPSKSVGSGASEEENIDSFDVSPNSGRWNVTSDNQTDDIVTDSILRMTTVNNATSDDITSGVGFEMNRGMSKTDGKVEYRMAASGGGNQTEFYRDQLGDKFDFEEGDNDGFLTVGTVANGIYSLTLVATPTLIHFDLYNVSTLLYHTLRFKVKSSVTSGVNIQLYVGTTPDFAGNALLTSTEWETLEIDLSILSEWTETDLEQLFRFRFAKIGGGVFASEVISFEFIELVGNLDYATHIENEIEDTWDWEVDNSTESWTGLVNMNVSDGFLRGTMAAGGSDDFISPVGLSIDTDLFTIFTVRLNTSDITMDIIIQADLGAGLINVAPETNIDSTSQTIYTFDLSDDADWTGTCIRLNIRFDEQDETLDGNEIVFIDYVLLLGHWADSDSVIGLWDQDDLVPLLNVSCHFTSNNSHSTTSDKAYFTVELLDLDGEIAYSAISDNYTDISDLWVQGKITYDVLRSKLTVTINADNLTLIDKWTFPSDFTEVSGRIPALFSHAISPYVFTSTFCQATSWQEMRLDYIKASYTERQWQQIEIPTDVDWWDDNWDIAHVNGTITDDSSWRLNVPSLDSVSGIMEQFASNGTALDAVAAVLGVFMAFTVYGVDANDGDLHEVFTILLELDLFFGGTSWGERIFLRAGGTNQYSQSQSYTVPTSEDIHIRSSFSIALSDERSRLSYKGRTWFLWEEPNNFGSVNDSTLTLDIADHVNVPSQEFVLGVNYTMIYKGDTEVWAIIEDFGFVERDLFSDIVDAIVEPIGNFLAEIFKTIFRFLADIFRIVGDLIIASVIAMQTAITVAINQIQGWLVTLGTTITTAINQIQGWLTTLGTTITTAVNQIQGWLTALGTTITTAVDQIEGWLNSIASTISDAIDEIAADIWTAFVAVADDFVTAIITQLTILAEDFAEFLDAMIAFLIPLLTALAEDFAGLLEDIIAFLLPLLGALAEAIITFIADLVFWIWDALNLPDVLAVIDVLLTGLVQFITGLPQFVTDWVNFLTAISDLFVVLGFIWIFVLPIAIAPTAGGCIDKMVEHAMISVIADWKIFGIGGRIPIIIPWGILLIWTMLDGTVFFNFF